MKEMETSCGQRDKRQSQNLMGAIEALTSKGFVILRAESSDHTKLVIHCANVGHPSLPNSELGTSSWKQEAEMRSQNLMNAIEALTSKGFVILKAESSDYTKLVIHFSDGEKSAHSKPKKVYMDGLDEGFTSP